MCYNSGGYVLQPSAALPEGEAQKVKEAAITHSPHAFVPKKELTEEERRERYRTRIDESIRPYTLAHEGAHHYLDRFFFLLQKTHGHEYCSYLCKRRKEGEKEEERWAPVELMEMQANKLPGYLMIQDKPGKAYAEKLMDSYGGERSLDNMRSLIRDMAEHFHTTETTARTRLLDLGYNEVRGLLRSANGRMVPSYLSDLSGSDIYLVSESESIQEYLRNPDFRVMLNSGKYLYVEGHYCRNEREYLFCDQFGCRHLSAYARNHMSECCLVFRQGRRNAATRLINGVFQKNVGRGRKTVEYVGPNGESRSPRMAGRCGRGWRRKWRKRRLLRSRLIR